MQLLQFFLGKKRCVMTKSIEIIDDEPEILSMLESLIKDNFKNVEIISGNSCHELEKAPDLLIMDYLMPNILGNERLDKCFLNGHVPNTIIFTAWSENIKNEIAKIREVNPNIIIIQKPNISLLIKTVEKMLYQKTLITICEKCKNPIFWLDLVDENVKLCEGCR